MPDDLGPCIEHGQWRNPKGYGVMERGGRRWLAHRWAWTQEHGPIPAGLFVLHRCDNPPCINVSHLFLGTKADNNADMRTKGRAAPVPRPNNTGSRHGNARLNEFAVRWIRAHVQAGRTQRDVAFMFGVSPVTINEIISRRAWRHV